MHRIPRVGYRPARSVATSGVKIRGKFPSSKMGRTVEYESTLERDFFYWLEFDEDVWEYYEQPLRLDYKYCGEERWYYPDLWVVCRCKTQLVEVKPHVRLVDEKQLVKFAAAEEYCRRMGYQFRIVTERQIRRPIVLDNLKLLYRYARVEPPLAASILAHETIKDHGIETLGALSAEFERVFGPDGVSFVMALLFRHAVSVEHAVPLGSGSRVFKEVSRG